MFKIIESIHMEPIRIQITKRMSNFRPGFVCKIAKYDELTQEDFVVRQVSQLDTMCDLSDGNNVFGIYGGKSDVDGFGCIYTQRMIFRTNEYQMGEKYGIGSKLYVSNRGLLTSKEPYKDAIYYGRVISPPTFDRQWFEALWS